MDPQSSASFIPKRPIGTSRANTSSAFGGLAFALSLLIFIAALVSAGGVFAYQKYLTGSIAQKTGDLQKAEGAFDPSVIQDLVRIDSRIVNSERLLQAHVAPSAIFAFLSAQTLQNAWFSGFSYELQQDGSALLTLNGQAENFSAVALQSDQFSTNNALKNVIFSDFTIDNTGKVIFTVNATVNPLLINYAKNLSTSTTSQ